MVVLTQLRGLHPGCRSTRRHVHLVRRQPAPHTAIERRLPSSSMSYERSRRAHGSLGPRSDAADADTPPGGRSGLGGTGYRRRRHPRDSARTLRGRRPVPVRPPQTFRPGTSAREPYYETRVTKILLACSLPPLSSTVTIPLEEPWMRPYYPGGPVSVRWVHGSQDGEECVKRRDTAPGGPEWSSAGLENVLAPGVVRPGARVRRGRTRRCVEQRQAFEKTAGCYARRVREGGRTAAWLVVQYKKQLTVHQIHEYGPPGQPIRLVSGSRRTSRGPSDVCEAD